MGIATFADLAFFTGFVPGGPEEDFVTTLVVPILVDETSPKWSALRRIFVEAYSLAVADLSRRVDAKSDGQPQRLPAAERQARRDRLAARSPGLKWEGSTIRA